MDNIKVFDQRLAQLRTQIPQFRAHSGAANKRLANAIINLELKRIETIIALENKLDKLRGLISVYKALCPTNEHMLADPIINLDLQLIAAKSNQRLPS